jgi:hypothetical protein
MSIPLLGKVPAGICIVCKGTLTPDHEHIYVDKFEYKLLAGIASVAMNDECVIITDEGLLPVHPKLSAGMMWFPCEITNTSPHDECSISFPHHHCGEGTDVLARDKSPEA